LSGVPIETNLGLLWLLWALLSGRFLLSRGALFPALDNLGLPKEMVRRSVAALEYGNWNLASLLAVWQRVVFGEGRW